MWKPSLKKSLLPVALALALLSGAAIVSPCLASSVEQIDGWLEAEKWKPAIAALKKWTKREPENGGAWAKLGQALQGQGSHREAAEAWQQADQLGFAAPITRFNVARALASSGDSGGAFEWLDRALEAGFGNLAMLIESPDLESLRGESKFSVVLQRAERNSYPCRHDPKHREFDFWAGDWNVFSAEGKRLGGNVIQGDLNGCALFESWNGTGGSTGRSINYFDAETEKWTQVWVDGRGGNIELIGEWTGSAMVLEGRHAYRDGRLELIRGTWTPLPDGRVRQLFEQSRDEGESWYTWFDGYYVRKKG